MIALASETADMSAPAEPATRRAEGSPRESRAGLRESAARLLGLLDRPLTSYYLILGCTLHTGLLDLAAATLGGAEIHKCLGEARLQFDGPQARSDGLVGPTHQRQTAAQIAQRCCMVGLQPQRLLIAGERLLMAFELDHRIAATDAGALREAVDSPRGWGSLLEIYAKQAVA